MPFYLLRVAATIAGLVVLLLIIIFLVCGRKGMMYLLALAAAVAVIMTVIVPLLARGYDPTLIVFLAALPIIALMVYAAEGYTELSNLSILAIVVSFAATSILADIAVKLAGFSGIVSDTSLIVGGERGLDLVKLLTSGIMLGALGGIIEMSVTQVATVIKLDALDPNAASAQIRAHANSIGVAHLGAVISTMFLLYSGASLSLLIVFSSPGTGAGNLLGYEPLTSEVVRILVGLIGTMLAMPIATFFAVRRVKKSRRPAC